MPPFKTKPAPSAEKVRGGFYTPDVVARFISEYVGESGETLLEPSCGDGAILQHLRQQSLHAIGVELIGSEARKAEDGTGAVVINDDFFSWSAGQADGSYDGIAGNPPYIRFGTWDEESRSRAIKQMIEAGLAPNRLTNAWVPFVVSSLRLLRVGGRLGLVLPAELLQVGYAKQLREHIASACSRVTIVSFRKLIFEGVLQEVVLLLAERGPGPARISTVELANAEELIELDLRELEADRPSLLDGEKWTKYFLNADQIELVRAVRQDVRLSTLGEFASVDVGVVTGRNSFFVLSPEDASSRGITDISIPIVTRSAQLRGIILDSGDVEYGSSVEKRMVLLDAKGIDVEAHPALKRYVREGEEFGVHEGYKCRTRKVWWQVPSIWQADAFMLRQIHNYPRLTADPERATSTDTVHRIRMLSGDPVLLATAFTNSATFAFSEVLGRSYGGGLLELEPTEAEALPIPNPDLVPNGLPKKVDELLKTGKVEEALDLVDQELLVKRLGFDPVEVSRLRDCWIQLRDRRQNRGRST